MIKGYFPHKTSDAIPASFGFAFILGKIGLQTDPTFSKHWDLCSRIRRGIYQRPVVTAEHDAFHHASFMLELCQQYNPGWNDFPLMLNIMAPNVDLTFINVWVEYLIEQLKPNMKPVLYTTLKHWNVNLQSGPNCEIVSKRILQKAELFLSEYKVELPSKPLYVDKLHYWEHADGAIQYAGDGLFEKVALPASPPAGETPPPTGETPPSGGSTDPIILPDPSPRVIWEITIPSFKIYIKRS